MLGTTWYGWPLAWMYVIVYPGAPRRIGWVNLAGDLVLWITVSLVVILLVARIAKAE
jgi:hypothetical protein